MDLDCEPDGVFQDADVDRAGGVDTQDEPKAGQTSQVKGLAFKVEAMRSRSWMPRSIYIQGSLIDIPFLCTNISVLRVKQMT